ncbi:MAG: hypothetical protein CL943_02905 [Candidatus Diapherotrites archaeon]|uniref:Calcineurin-like phosphoesterase domain-containing protein n=1 Tax=Candidatus Iainarchaeum sp. TaxID=3101447 RepID=A0A2D6M1C3_9ARCH|nr:hypothetical protein [Candidatus Diapherotrites archaeon]
MKVAILSDFHLGFGEGTERAEESFEQAASALRLALDNNAELILHTGDLFDEDIPSQETWDKTFKLFSILNEKKSDVLVVKEKKDEKKEFHFSHLPLIAIHGTHEYRGKELKNALEVLESAGLLVHLHACTATIGNLVVHGLGGVPEKKALDALKMWGPKPVEGKKNVILLHQSIKEFLPFDDDMIATISLADLPNGFDLVVNGHLHWTSEQNVAAGRFIMPGSTIITQMKRLEAEKGKGIFIWDTEADALEFLSIPNQRKFFYKKLEFKEAERDKIKARVEKTLEEILAPTFPQKPLVKIKLVGSLAKGLQQGDISLKQQTEKFKDKALISVSRNFEAISFAKKLEELRSLQKSRKSVTAMGLDLLEKNLSQTSFGNAFDPRDLFEMLAIGKIDKAVEKFLNNAPKREKV